MNTLGSGRVKHPLTVERGYTLQMKTYPGLYASLVKECEGKRTQATEEIERDLHRSVQLAWKGRPMRQEICCWRPILQSTMGNLVPFSKSATAFVVVSLSGSPESTLK